MEASTVNKDIFFLEARQLYSSSHSDAVQNHIASCRGTALPIRINLT